MNTKLIKNPLFPELNDDAYNEPRIQNIQPDVPSKSELLFLIFLLLKSAYVNIIFTITDELFKLYLCFYRTFMFLWIENNSSVRKLLHYIKEN